MAKSSDLPGVVATGADSPVLTDAFNVFRATCEDAGFDVTGWHITTLPEAAASPRCLVGNNGASTPFTSNLGWTDLEAARCLWHFTDALRAKLELDQHDDPKRVALRNF